MSGNWGFEEGFYHFLIDDTGSLGLNCLGSNVACADHLLSLLESGIWVHTLQSACVQPPGTVPGTESLMRSSRGQRFSRVATTSSGRMKCVLCELGLLETRAWFPLSVAPRGSSLC